MVSINKTNSKPYYEQLVLSIKEEILSGILLPGDRLLSVREMAKYLSMNPNTVSKAYKLLESQDVIITIKGKGTYIKKIDPPIRNEKKIATLKEQLNALIIDSNYLGIEKQELQQWVDELYQQLKGENE